MQEDAASDNRGDDATDRLLRDTFGVTDEGIEALKRRANEDAERERLHPVPVIKGRAGYHPPADDEHDPT
jgi:hypothetical protein